MRCGAADSGSRRVIVRRELDRRRLDRLVEELARDARQPVRLYLVGGTSAVREGWRAASIDADLHADDESVFRRIQQIKEALDLNVELVRPERFVPPLADARDRHVFLERVGNLELHHYDPYSQVLAKVVRGFDRDLEDARAFIEHGMVRPAKLGRLVQGIPDEAYAAYPQLSREGVEEAVEEFVASCGDSS